MGLVSRNVLLILQISLPVLGVAVVGWVVFLIGFVSFNRGDNL